MRRDTDTHACRAGEVQRIVQVQLRQEGREADDRYDAHDGLLLVPWTVG